ncbi:transglycosylase domain-containing protein [Chthonobacter rhizosphaerae]|uniref:transglycosylase domain-containing protein n=1 Tax=Chthonobacter rhizosphaerae TaxID=2735553 RepID=UPI0015EF6C2B|nr:penicillin-binding protein 1A [Chthonobacter rhizosphaerae]
MRGRDRTEGRIEPRLGRDTGDGDLRVTLDDRATGAPVRGRDRDPLSPRHGRQDGRDGAPSSPRHGRHDARAEPRLGAGPSRWQDDEPDLPFDDEEIAPVAKAKRGKRADDKAGRGRRKPRRSLTGRMMRGLVSTGLTLGLWGAIGVGGLLAYTAATMPPTSEWTVPKRPPNVEIVDANGQLIANRGDTGGEALRLEQMPPYLPEAVMAIEDRRFLTHFGIDPIGLARAVVTNVAAGNVVQGGSTLTQQLAKNLFLEPDRTLERKLQEVLLALWLEWKFSKDEILEMYLNRVYLGAGSYGVDGAARRYFGKSARELTLGESAIIAGLLKAPSRYAPTRDPDLARERARLVLAAMAEEGYISRAEAKKAAEAPSRIVMAHNARAENYVADWVMELLPGYVASVAGDIVVETTIDVDMQKAAETALRETLAAEGKSHNVSQGALVALDNGGAVKALVGGRDYAESQFNRAVAARRQPGSAFKPFVFLAAVEQGYTPDHIVVDEPISIKGWQPKNYSRDYMGPVTLTTALAKSLNTVAARLAAEVGPATVAQTARRVGIVSRLHDSPSIALGTAEVTPLEITAAYVPFANGGYGVIPYVIESIRTKDGEELFRRQGDGTGQVIEPRVVGTMNQMLQTVLYAGTGQKAVLKDRPAAGKTGTSQDFRDAWFLGYVNGLTTGVWLGNDDNSPTKKATGGSVTATVWNRFMTKATAGMAVGPLPGLDLVPPLVVDPGTPIANADGLPVVPDTAPPPMPPVDVGVRADGPTDVERGLLERLFGG